MIDITMCLETRHLDGDMEWLSYRVVTWDLQELGRSDAYVTLDVADTECRNLAVRSR